MHCNELYLQKLEVIPRIQSFVTNCTRQDPMRNFDWVLGFMLVLIKHFSLSITNLKYFYTRHFRVIFYVSHLVYQCKRSNLYEDLQEQVIIRTKYKVKNCTNRFCAVAFIFACNTCTRREPILISYLVIITFI